MQLDIVSYNQLTSENSQKLLIKALLEKGIVGIANVPNFLEKSQHFVQVARKFSALDEALKQKYAPKRELLDTEGYELGAEKFQDAAGNWQIDDKKASFYAFVPNRPKNKWPEEVDLKSAYLALGELIFATGKHVLNAIGLNETASIHHDQLVGYGRMLHYQKAGKTHEANPNWCGAHFDHGLFTGLMPSYYFQAGEEVDEPEDAGLYIFPTNGSQFEKIAATDKSVLLFQVGEFGQLASHDLIRATKHLVKKAAGEIERYSFALFYSASDDTLIHSTSALTKDLRFVNHKNADGSILYQKWQDASYEKYYAVNKID